MKILENYYNNLIAFISSPAFLRASFLIFIGLLIFLNAYKFIKKRKSWKSVVPETNDTKKYKKFLKDKLRYFLEVGLVVNLILIFGASVTFAAYTFPTPKVISPSGPSLESITEVTKNKPLIIEFDRPIDKKMIKKTITPEIDGSWQFFGKDDPFFVDSLKFTPNETLKAETRYTVSLTDIKNIFGKSLDNYLFSFNTPPAAKITKVTPESALKDMKPTQEFKIETDFPHEDSTEFEFNFEPQVNLIVKKEKDTTYVIKAKEGFKKGTDYNLKIFRRLISLNYETKEKKDLEEKEEVFNGNYKTVEAPGVKDYSPKGYGILANTSIKIEFKQEMDPLSEKAISISPDTGGSFIWEGAKTLKFIPKIDLNKNTKYTVLVGKIAKAIDGSPFEEEFKFDFTTIGYAGVTGFSPANGSSNAQINSPISVTFDQAVDQGSAESKFSISPGLNGNFSWSGNKMTFNHGGMSYGTKYNVNVSSGIKSVNGLDSNRSFSSSFTTRSQSVTLNVPSYRQSHMYSCMASAARQALAYRGAYVSEETLMSKMGYDNTPFSGTWGDPNAIWGDPDNGVVGNIDGPSGGVTWGYGAHWGPTAKAMSSYRQVETKNNWDVQGIAREIANGNPVVVFWVNGIWPSYVVNWKTPSGKTVRAVNGMHVQVVKGFTGTVENPTSFIVNDSGYGYPSRTFDVGTFKAKWSWYGNTAIIVR